MNGVRKKSGTEAFPESQHTHILVIVPGTQFKFI